MNVHTSEALVAGPGEFILPIGEGMGDDVDVVEAFFRRFFVFHPSPTNRMHGGGQKNLNETILKC